MACGLESRGFCVTIAVESGASVTEPSQIAIRVEGLTRTYKGVAAVDNLSLEVHVGDIYGFLGPNGAGKNHRNADDVGPHS